MKKIITRIAYIYMGLPFLIFCVGFMRWYIGLPLAAIALYGLVRMCMSAEETWLPERTSKNIGKLFLSSIIILAWVLVAGIGKVFWQNSDHSVRNTIFRILIDYSWPVVNEEGRGVIYYIGFWLPAALVGKVFGLSAGYAFQVFWAFLGIFLTYYLICDRLKKLVIWPLFVFIFFSGLDMIGLAINNAIEGQRTAWRALDAHIEWWTYGYQFSSISTQLFWAFNQAVYGWLVTLLLLKTAKNRYVVLLVAQLLLCSTFPFVGIIPVLLWVCFTRKYGEAKGKEWWKAFGKDTFSFENIVGGGAIGIGTFLYLMSNSSGQMVGLSGTSGDTASFGTQLVKYLLFIGIEIGIYVVLLFRYNRKNSLFYIAVAWLCVCPIVHIGYFADFCMKASIPCMVILILCVVEALSKAAGEKHFVTLVLLLITLLFGAITPVHEFFRTMKYTKEQIIDNAPYEYKYADEDVVFYTDNFGVDAKNSFFFKYMAK